MLRPISLDVTHLAARLSTAQSSGIDKVDLAYARHFGPAKCETLVHYGFFKPRFYPSAELRGLLHVCVDTAPRSGYSQVYRWLTGASPPTTSDCSDDRTPADRAAKRAGATHRLTQLGWRLAPGKTDLPPNAIYLNVAQYLFEHHRYFGWLDQRPDVLPVFLVHDLLPFDWPEFFRPNYRERFERRWQTIMTRARAIITTTVSVRDRIVEEFQNRGRDACPIHVEPLPSPLGARTALADPRLADVPYFIVVGTIEPRKNHLLLLSIWRRMAEESPTPPKLVVVGKRGWENEQVLDVLDRSTSVRPHICEISNLGEDALAMLIGNSRALLMPSFAEGYGLPVVEALSLGAPVIASDLPVFREVSQGCAQFLHPLDGLGWRHAIERLAHPRQHRSQTPTTFQPPDWPRYFEKLEKFLAALG